MIRTNFQFSVHGFRFSNSFVNKVFHLPFPFNKDIDTYGRCGGMAFAALDYYFAGIPIPTHIPGDFAPGTVPPDGHPLADYIYNRLMDSFVLNGLTFAAWTQALDHRTLLRGKGVPLMTRQDQVPMLLAEIGAGRPVALGLVSAGPDDILLTGIGSNHQVVAYGFDLDAAGGILQVYTYDNNYPDQEVSLTLNMNGGPVSASTGASWRGFFVEAYSPAAPHYMDLVGVSGVAVSDRTPLVGAPLTADFQVHNPGASPTHLSELAFRVTGPDGREIPGLLAGDGNANPLLPSDQRHLASTAAAFGAVPGTHTIEATYVSAAGHVHVVPTTGRAIVSVQPNLRTMTTAVDLTAPPRFGTPVTFRVTALDAQLRISVPGARVWIHQPAAGGPGTDLDLGDADGTPLTHTFWRVKDAPGARGAWLYPTGLVRAPGYADADIDFGFPAAP